MAEEDQTAGASEDVHVTFNVKAANDQKYVLTLSENATVSDLKGKLATAEYADIPVERQRLIYSGRVLKDTDTLASFKLKDGNTIHLVKGAASNARQNPTSQSTSSTSPAGQPSNPASNVPTNIAAGTGNNPFAALTGARYAGFHGLPSASTFGPDGGMGPPPDPDTLLRLLDDPNVLQQFNEMMNNPQVIDMMQNAPEMRANPQFREMFRNPETRRMLTDPNMIRQVLQIHRAFGGAGGGENAFPAPGVTNTTPQQDGAGNQGQEGTDPPAFNPFALFGNLPGGAGGAGANPFASLFPQGQTQAGQTTQPSERTGEAQEQPNQQNQPTQPTQPSPANPFAALFGAPPSGDANSQGANPIAQMTQQMMQNPEAMRAAMQMMQGMNGGGLGAGQGADEGAGQGAGGNGLGGMPWMFGGAQPQASPPDDRPPEDRYADQLRQLNDMGFYEFERNVQALRRSGGSVQGAVEYLLSGS
ncbi:hypothetical protein P152DRAFT_458780 [Eremomyces bilateralis CBS 781.70]|uniref:Ubiquitin-domain-containing protein n=1 Tax=Eremomyces bilateralis CBS 781.70 TaxID=1392243 RepID=A0A6G1G346_9PEZI|nr:uncharacterized protein P152DRAFT_458780 [Eremomyces bilateralis CBS 781.70]KAF1812412.1 hypothetical protein P152DRAFT_458780 [Eremomyces bilateralis CBS 781.70]